MQPHMSLAAIELLEQGAEYAESVGALPPISLADFRRLLATARSGIADSERLPEWAQGVSPDVLALCKAADDFLSAQRNNAVGMGSASGMMNAAEDLARIEFKRVYNLTPPRIKTEAFARLHDALASVNRTAQRADAARGKTPTSERGANDE